MKIVNAKCESNMENRKREMRESNMENRKREMQYGKWK